ncbi:hypothetical protein [Microvirga lotononidis]|uniref:Uncharacterized protein n=1 Tax=Microvirga lotononidis TaxID=864069 RepID=I4YRR0_9HYPH|nr:hypothetical protein [Microvirga lotononidis]EIM26652.1 hypothetical protein MicloDRAFT_00032010 [Microvirga lotononidis]WQO32114.1 hypothetical protein U0023_35290 [Microvirga lotononidis]
MAEPLSNSLQQAFDQVNAFARTDEDLRELADIIGPEALEHVKQARECLDLIIKSWEQGRTDGLSVHGYFLQHQEHIRQSLEIAESYTALVADAFRASRDDAEQLPAPVAPETPWLFSIPLDRTMQEAALWVPHFRTFAKRRNSQAILEAIEAGDVQIHLVLDRGEVVAAIGTRVFDHERGRIGELMWWGGKSIPATQSVLPELFQFLGEQGCSRLIATGREGLTRILEPHGFKRTQITLEKPFNVR